MRKLRDDKGAINVEFILVFPFLLTMLLGGIMLSMTVADKSTMQSTASVGAQVASYEGGDNEVVRRYIQSSLDSRLLTAKASNATVKITVIQGGTPVSTAYPANETSGTAGGIYGDPGSPILVEVYINDYFIPFISAEKFRFGGAAVMRNSTP